MSSSSARFEDRSFWADLAPDLSIEQDILLPRFGVASPEGLLPDLRREGYVNVADAFDEPTLAPLRALVARLAERGVPLPFAFVYDQAWALFQAVSPFLTAALGEGYRALPDFWMWRVEGDDAAHGWGPHRDRVRPTVDADNNPFSLTVWLPLTDATPLNGCMYVLPAHRDRCFKKRVWDGADNGTVDALQDIRALPASAGSLLAWNQGLLHWGGRASRLADGPRVSCSFEFQRSDRSPYNPPLLDPRVRPSFEARLGLVGRLILQYRHMYPLDVETALVAADLRDRYMPGDEMATVA